MEMYKLYHYTAKVNDEIIGSCMPTWKDLCKGYIRRTIEYVPDCEVEVIETTVWHKIQTWKEANELKSKLELENSDAINVSFGQFTTENTYMVAMTKKYENI